MKKQVRLNRECTTVEEMLLTVSYPDNWTADQIEEAIYNSDQLKESRWIVYDGDVLSTSLDIIGDGDGAVDIALHEEMAERV